MSTMNKISTKRGPSTLVRAQFGPGMLLQHEDLNALNTYTRDLSRLLFRSFFGCGVICGLKVEVKEDCGMVFLTVEAGIALDCSGDPIQVPKDTRFPIDEDCDPNEPLSGTFWVVLCGKVRQCAPRTSMCASDDDETPSTPTRERDEFEIRVVPDRPECACGCPEPEDDPVPVEDDCQYADPDDPCFEKHYDGICGCECGNDCSDSNCKCVLLARIKKNEDDTDWTVEHRVRRFIRPVLMRDPLSIPPPAESQGPATGSAAMTMKLSKKKRYKKA